MNKDRFEELLAGLPPEIAAKQRAARVKFQTEGATQMDELNSRFYVVDTVMGMYRNANGHTIPETAFSIGRFQNGNGDTVYVRRGNKEEYPSSDVVRGLSTQIKAQQTGFTKLDATEQSRIMKEALSGKPDPRFGNHLSNEVNKRHFSQLKSAR